MKKGNKWYVLKIGIKSFLYIFTDFSPMSKYMLFLTLFPAPTCVSWVTFFIITNNWKWRILKSITWILPIFLRFGVHGDRNHIWAVFQPADQRTPLKGDKRCNVQKQNESEIKLKIEKGKKTNGWYFSAQNLFKLASRPYSVNDFDCTSPFKALYQ